MDSKLRAKVLTMAAATLGLSLVGACSKKSEPAAPEAGEQAAGGEGSCGGEQSCGAAKEGETKTGDEAAPAEGGSAEGGGESSCGGTGGK
jgi:hypothetical protein